MPADRPDHRPATDHTAAILAVKSLADAKSRLTGWDDHNRRALVTAMLADTIAAIRAKYEPKAVSVDFTDGLSLEFDRWRMNLRTSNTEPLIRLNVESRGDAALMQAKTAEVLGEMAKLGAVAADH